MPELPEVETARRGVARALRGRRVVGVVVRDRRLRWPVPRDLAPRLAERTLEDVERRAKYLLLRFGDGTCIVHLGMSGSLRVVAADEPLRVHDHVDLAFDDGRVLRLHDPRRFGAVLWTGGDPLAHPLLRHLGPEPLSPAFDGAHLARAARGRTLAVKAFVMDARVVVGVGNIYASEALHRAAVHPARAAGRISRARYDALARHVREVLEAAIARGGTTLRDFVGSGGELGEFAFDLEVYDREGEPCIRCGGTIKRTVIGQRSTFHCGGCQR